MAALEYAPAWQTEELAEEWVERSTSSARTGSSSGGSQSTPTSAAHQSFDSTKHLAQTTSLNMATGKMRIVSGHTTFPSPQVHKSLTSHSQKRQSSINLTYDAAPSPPTSHRSDSISSESGNSMTAPPQADHSVAGSTMPAGTFLVRADNPDAANPDDGAAPAGLKRNPFIGGGGDIGAGEGGSLFQRLELERMFDPPREAMEPITEAQEEDNESLRTAGMLQATTGENEKDVSHAQVQDAGVPLRRTSHSYVPTRPSRLSNSMTPPSVNNSMSSSTNSSAEEISARVIRETSIRYESSPKDQVAEGQEYDSETDSSGDGQSYKASTGHRQNKLRRFSGQEGSMRDVEFTFSPSPIRKRPSAQTLATHTSHSVSGSISPASGQKAGTAKAPFRLFQRRIDPEGYDTVQTKAFIENITVGGTPLKDLVSRAGSGVGIGSPSPVNRNSSGRGKYAIGGKGRISGTSSLAEDTSRRRYQGQLAKQWSTSSGSAEGTSGSFASGDVGEASELEERSSKRIRLSTSPSSAEGHLNEASPEYQQEHSAAEDNEEYDYSASGSEDAMDQRSTVTSLCVSQSRTKPQDQSSSAVKDSFHRSIDPSSASDVPEDAPVGKQVQRRSWNEKGQELLERIRQDGTSDKSDSWNSWSRSNDDQAGQGEDTAPFPQAAFKIQQAREPSTSKPQYGTVTSSNSGGTASSSSTITSRYLSAGINMLEKIKERKVSDSSGTGVCTDGDARGDMNLTRTRLRLDSERRQSPSISRQTKSRPQSAASSVPRTASSHSTIRPSQNDAKDLNGTVRSDSSSSSHRSSFVASLGKGAAPAMQLRTIVESPSTSIAFGGSDEAIQREQTEEQGSRLLRSQQEDMNRYISSTSTANTANTAVSTSFVKHRGPPPPTPHGRAQGVRTIGLNDIPQIPRQVGNMVFDPERGWFRASKAARQHFEGETNSANGFEGKSSSAESVDIFAGLESLRDEERTLQLEPSPGSAVAQRHGNDLSPVIEVSVSPSPKEEYISKSPADRKHMAESPVLPIKTASPTILSQPSPRKNSANIQPNVVSSMQTLSIRDEAAKSREEVELRESPAAVKARSSTSPKALVQRPELREHASAPTPMQTDPLQATPAVRSILKTGSTEVSGGQTTRVLATPLPTMKIVTADDSARRSVSFSDGRTYGKIRNTSTKQGKAVARKQRNWNALVPEDDIFNSQDGSIGAEQGFLPMQPSVRSKRIQNMLADLSKNGKSKTAIALLSEASEISPSRTNDLTSETSFPSRVRSSRKSKADATFLTECSFGVAHDRLVEVLTEVQPYEAHWELLSKLDLSKRGVDSVARLKEFCPDLDEVNLNDNHIGYLSGLPASIRRLHISSNQLTNVSSVDYLANLQVLDVSRNQIDSVNALSCLKHLRELCLDHNKVKDLKDIMEIDSLVKLSCKGNNIKTVDLSSAQWTLMESLDLSHNQISHVEGLENLTSLSTLNLDHNRLANCTPASDMLSLRVLRVSHNQLATLDLSLFPRLRSFYADGNRIETLWRSKKQSIARLEYLSLRDQDVRYLRLSHDDMRDVKRLYISGNHLTNSFFPTRPLFSLVYLEAAACSMAEWPENFAARLPNLRILNVNYNFLEDLSGLEGIQGLRKLMMIGCRLGEERSSSVMRSIRAIGTLEEIDLRMNPMNLNYYLPLILNESTPSTILYPAETSGSHQVTSLSTIDKWTGMDNKFRQLLPDKWYFKRLVYRGAIKLACETIEVIDGIRLTNSEHRKAIAVMEDAAVKGKTAV
ncbi:hypothetical protein NliqN6_6765 [Naganishia liquefaciens]|uniref:Uncharacterized protein n=1 Tax=Naganishia liquefaciens TaxID=104408 RepID=A0A8H3U0R9_9TREE|nr:hypothetical protein NliqN6_6765 [Naganishia liquefaciens]